MDELKSAVDAFCAYLSGERFCSTMTVISYKRALEKAVAVLHSEFPDITSWKDVGERQMRVIARELNFGAEAKELSSATVAHDLYALNSFLSYMVMKGRLPVSPKDAVKAPRVKRPLPRVLTMSEVEELLSVKPRTDLEVRDLAIAELFFSSGLRLSELIGLDLDDYSAIDREVRVRRGKGGKDRVVPVGSRAIARLGSYLAIRDKFKPSDKALFLSRMGKRLTGRAVEQNLKKLAGRAGLNANVFPHKLRHSFATQLVEHGADLRSVQEMLGHASLAATEIYTNLDFEHLKKVYERSHPRAKRKDGEDQD